MATLPCLEQLHSFDMDGPLPSCVAAIPGGGYVTGHSESTDAETNIMRLWGERGEAVATLETGSARCVACGPSGDIALGCTDGRLEVWRGKALTMTCTGHTSAIDAVAVSPLDGAIVSGSSDKTAKVWSGSTGACVATLEGHTDGVRAVCVLGNGDVVSGSQDHTVRVWERGTWTCTSVHEQRSAVYSLEAMPLDGFAVGEFQFGVSAWRGGVQQWRVETGHPVDGIAVVNDVVVAGTCYDALVVFEDSHVWFPDHEVYYGEPLRLEGGNKFALVMQETCTVYRVVRRSRIDAIRIMVAAWEAHGGAPPPLFAGVSGPTPPAGVLARALCLRRLCRPRGETAIGRAAELVEPFAQSVVAYL